MKSVRRHVSEPTDIDNVSLIHNHVVRVEVQSDQLVIELANAKGAGVAKCRLVFAAWTPCELRSETMNPKCHSSLFFLAMFHTNSIITVAGLPRMSLQAGLSNVAAYFAIVRLLGPCSVGAVYKKHQQDGKGSHDDLLSLCCDGGHYCVGIWRPPTIPSHVRLRQPFRTKSNWGPQLMEQYWCNLENLAAPFLSRGRQSETGGVELWQ